MIRRPWLLFALAAAIGAGVPPASSNPNKATLSTQVTSMPRTHKQGRLGGLFPKGPQRRQSGVRQSMAQQQRSAIKRRNRAAHKRNCGARA